MFFVRFYMLFDVGYWNPEFNFLLVYLTKNYINMQKLIGLKAYTFNNFNILWPNKLCFIDYNIS